MNHFILNDNQLTIISKSDNCQVSYQDNQFNLEVIKETKAEIKIEINHSQPIALNYLINEFARVELIEQINQATEINRTIKLNHTSTLAKVVINETNQTITVNETIDLDKHAHLETTLAELSDGSVSGKYVVNLNGEFARASSLLASISKDNEKKDFDVRINHYGVQTDGEIANFGVCKDTARLTFNGTGYVARGAVGSNAHQTSRIMIFDPKCVAKANPYLLIDENDIMASHAAAVGKMDEDHLYYLQSRGLTKKQASQLITYGYIMPIVNKINNEAMKDHVKQIIEKKVG